MAAAGPLGLTPREREVVVLLRDGRRAAEIAAELGLSIYTIRAHLASAQLHAGARTLPHLVAMLVEAEEAPDHPTSDVDRLGIAAPDICPAPAGVKTPSRRR